MEEKVQAIVYDCEILKAVPSQFSYCEKGIKYCSGWRDHAPKDQSKLLLRSPG